MYPKENNDMLNAIVVSFYCENKNECRKKAIEKLQERGVIDIKYWLYRERFKAPSFEEISQNVRDAGEYAFIDDDVYEKIRLQMYRFVNIANRWSRSIEWSHYTNMFHLLARYWYSIIKKNNVEILIMNGPPHTILDINLYIVCIGLNLKIICGQFTSFIPDKFAMSKSIDSIGINDFGIIFDYAHQNLEFSFEKELDYMKIIKPVCISDDMLLSDIVKSAIKSISKLSVNKQKISAGIRRIGMRLIRKSLEIEYKKNASIYQVDFDKNAKYVYFPLHLQPEATTDTLGGKYEDQLLAIEAVAKIIPQDWVIYVKENPKQTFYKRGKFFYYRLTSIKKAKLVKNETNTYELIKHCQFVSTITGTVGWEAITGGKNVLIFGAAWYRTLPRVFEYSSDIKVDDIINYSITNEEFEKRYNEFYRHWFTGMGYVGDVNYKKYENDEELYNSLKLAIENY